MSLDGDKKMTKRLENISRFTDYLTKTLALPKDSIEFVENNEDFSADARLYVSSLIEGYGETVQEIDEIKRAANSNLSLTKLKQSISRRTGVPEESIRFKNPDGGILSGKYHVSTLRDMYENWGEE